jgi:hypothetical protein
MQQEFDVKAMSEKIFQMKQTASELKEMGSSLPALDRNVARILASIKMLEIGISDIVALDV